MTKKLISILLVLCVVATGLFAGGGNEVYPSKDIEFTVGAGLLSLFSAVHSM